MLNKVTIIGRLGADPDIRYMPNGTPVANISVATNRKIEGRDYTEWHKVIAYGKLTDIAGKYLQKGTLAFVEGRLQTRQWETKEGEKRSTTEIVANVLLGLDRTKPRDGDGNNCDAGAEDDIPF